MTLLKTVGFVGIVAFAGLSLAVAPLPAGQAAAVRSKLPDHPAQPAASPRQPSRVYIGMHMLRLTDMDITNNQFSVDCWLWFRWTDDRLKPYESFEVINGKINFQKVERLSKVDGVNYACVRVQATLTSFWDVSRFPLGNQKVAVEIEDDDLAADQLVYVPDGGSCGVDGNFRIAGWLHKGFSCDVLNHSYATNYGDPRYRAGTELPYSRAIFTLQLHRTDLFHSFKIFLGLYLSALVAFTVFFVKADHRLSLIVGAIFAVVTSHTVVASYLPDAGVLTLADKLHLVTAGVVLVAMFETAYSLHMLHQRHEIRSKRMDRLTFYVLAPVFILTNIWLLIG